MLSQGRGRDFSACHLEVENRPRHQFNPWNNRTPQHPRNNRFCQANVPMLQIQPYSYCTHTWWLPKHTGSFDVQYLDTGPPSNPKADLQTFPLKLFNGETLLLPKVYYVPQLQKHLICASMVAASGADIHIRGSSCVSQLGEVSCTIYQTDRLYPSLCEYWSSTPTLEQYLHPHTRIQPSHSSSQLCLS